MGTVCWRGPSRSAPAARASQGARAFRSAATAMHREARRCGNAFAGLRGPLLGAVAVGDCPVAEHPATRAPPVTPSRDKHSRHQRRAAHTELAMSSRGKTRAQPKTLSPPSWNAACDWDAPLALRPRNALATPAAWHTTPLRGPVADGGSPEPSVSLCAQHL